MSMVVFVIVLLLVSDRAGCDMRRAGLGQAGPTQLHDIASRKYYLRRRTDHCEGAHGSWRKGGKTRLVMPGEGAVQASNQGRIRGSRVADWPGWLVFHGWSA